MIAAAPAAPIAPQPADEAFEALKELSEKASLSKHPAEKWEVHSGRLIRAENPWLKHIATCHEEDDAAFIVASVNYVRNLIAGRVNRG